MLYLIASFLLGALMISYIFARYARENNFIDGEWVEKETPLEKTYRKFTKETGIDLTAGEKIEAARMYLMGDDNDVLERPICPFCKERHDTRIACPEYEDSDIDKHVFGSFIFNALR